MNENIVVYEAPEAEIVVKDFDEVKMGSDFNFTSSGFDFGYTPDENEKDDFFN